jgi:pyochelin biosynthesis protein PchC
VTTSATATNLWLRTYHPAPESRARLVCFPHAGGSASYFFPVSAALSPEFEVLAIQYPGRQDRRGEGFVDSIEDLAEQIYQALRPSVEPPFAFFGHSMGAVLAFEVARLFEARDGYGPSVLFASGRRAPSRFRDESVHLRDDAGIVEEMQNLGGTAAQVLQDQELLEMVLPAVRNDYRAVETYRRGPEATIGVPVVIITGDDDPRTSPAEAAAWAEHTTAGTELYTFSGGHFFIEQHQSEVVGVLADELRQRH